MNTQRRSYRILTGPTAAGKTDWLLRRAQHTPLVVVSADSRQVYRHMNIGTGKTTTAEQEKVTQFGLDLLEPSEKISVFLYLQHTSVWLNELESYHGEVWLCGGSGLYIRALLEGLDLGVVPWPELRPWIEAALERIGPANMAQALGLKLADPHNPRRVLRAVEALCTDAAGLRQVEEAVESPAPLIAVAGRADQISGKHNSESGSIVTRISAEQVRARLDSWQCAGLAVLDPGKEQLELRIRQRVEHMFHSGLLEECERLVQFGCADAPVVRDGIGYREGLAVLRGELDPAAAIERTILRTRQYAKRQRTYFRGMAWPFYTEDSLPFL